MSLRKIGLLLLCTISIFISCENDDDLQQLPTQTIRDRGEQQLADNISLLEYLTTHYYNAGDFEGSTNPKIDDLIIGEVPANGVLPNATDRILYTDDNDDTNDAVQVITTTFAETEYEYYILELNKGGGTTSPNFSDRVRVVYQGSLLDGSVFDSAVTPVDLNLVGDGATVAGTISGWRKVFPMFKVSESLTNNGDGTFSFTNHGTGVMFLPSGLSYFANPPTNSGIPLYAPLIFKFELLQSFIVDHDNDGVPSYLEDLNNDNEFIIDPDNPDTDDDTDGDGLPDYVDVDDDGDGILTIDEDLEDTDLDFDSDGDGDPTNDKNGDGDPTNDDTDGDGIPNYLDTDDTIAKD